MMEIGRFNWDECSECPSLNKDDECPYDQDPDLLELSFNNDAITCFGKCKTPTWKEIREMRAELAELRKDREKLTIIKKGIDTIERAVKMDLEEGRCITDARWQFTINAARIDFRAAIDAAATEEADDDKNILHDRLVEALEDVLPYLPNVKQFDEGDPDPAGKIERLLAEAKGDSDEAN